MAITVPGASGTQVTISTGTGDVLNLASQIGSLLATIQGAGTLVVTADSVSGAIPPAPTFGSPEPTGTEGEVYRLYQAFFDRVPDSAGLAAWTSLLDSSNVSLVNVADAMASSPEFTQLHGSLSDSDFINLVYENMFGRDADAGGMQFWLSSLAGGASRGAVATSIAEGTEAQSGDHTTPQQADDDEIFRLYEAAFARAPDQGGLSFWASAMANGATVAQVAAAIAGSEEFATLAGSPAATFAAAMYQNALHRIGDPGGLAFWTAAIAGGESLADVLRAFADSGESKAFWASHPQTSELLVSGGPGGLNIAVPTGYNYIVVNDATPDTLSASNAAIIAGTVGGTFFVSGNSTVAATAGNNIVNATGTYALSFGPGDNLINAFGSGTIATDLGHSTVVAAGSGAGNFIQSNGTDNINAQFGDNTVTATGDNSTISGGFGNLTVSVSGNNELVNGGVGATTVDAGGAGLTVQGGTGPLDFVGGAGGATIIGGFGGSTVFASASSDITFNGPGDLAYSASIGSATLNAAGSTGNVNASLSGGDDSITAGAGSETLSAGAGTNNFLFDSANTAGATDFITDSLANIAGDTFTFSNYGSAPVVGVNGSGQVTVTLSDSTTVVFTNLTDPNQITGHIV